MHTPEVTATLLEGLAWNSDGLLPVVIQDANTNAVLTLAHANREALRETLRTQATVLYSRSRKALWRKGETSGNTQRVLEVRYDCDGDALLYRVIPNGPACHTGETTCFYRSLSAAGGAAPAPSIASALTHLEAVIEARRTASPETSYVATLFARGLDRCAQKVGEEAVEVVIAAKNEPDEPLVGEVADLFFHTLVLLAQRGIRLDRVGAELLQRAGR